MIAIVLNKSIWANDRIMSLWSTRPTTVLAGNDHYFHTDCPSVPKLRNQATITAHRLCGSLMTRVLLYLFYPAVKSTLGKLNIAVCSMTWKDMFLSQCSAHVVFAIYIYMHKNILIGHNIRVQGTAQKARHMIWRNARGKANVLTLLKAYLEGRK